ncbi:uncharacterized protein K02A2.6-like [Diachasma alloeum]|uniref:uncharacterized protein K02A2.6-like n=1 Tax=Diachasma alloeum TaxID=454923 RepID=UPI000738451E|nr:uncharacterized protein K02A2.6-like [Diachasma alloeum]
MLGAEGYILLSSLCAPDLPGIKEYPVLVKLMSDHLKPKPSFITERFRFNMCNQTEGQTVSEYIATLKELSTYCEHGTGLNDALRDRLVCGLRNKTTRKKLLSEKNLTYERAVEIAISDEAAIRDTGEMETQRTTGSLNFVQQQSRGERSFEFSLYSKQWKFRSYTGAPLIPLGVLKVNVEYRGKSRELDLFVMPGSSGPIVGGEWIRALEIPLVEGCNNVNIKRVSNEGSIDVDNLKKDFPSVFTEKLGRFNGGTFKLELKADSKPIFVKPRVLPYAMMDKVEQELRRLVENYVIYPVESSEWATPVVPVIKDSGEIRICGDYKTTLNKCIKVDKYPIPRISDLLSKINEGKVYGKIDLSHAYQQVELDKDSQLLTNISTYKGLFAYKRLCFGVASAPGLFQRLMEKLLSGIPGVIVFFYDVLVFGSTQDEHFKRLLMVLNKLKESGLTAKFEKCKFFASEVKFLCFKIDQDGIHALPDKVKAINEIQIPKDVTELKRFLGMANYYSKFVKNYTEIVSPLYELLKGGIKWFWSRKQQSAFDEIKKKLISSEVLMHYIHHLPIKITYDASPVGLGAVLSYILPDKRVRPVAFFSRSLTRAEKNYSQLDREALALVFVVKSCHQFVWGRNFLLETDHKPLKYIFDPNKSLPSNVAGRVQRWAVFLAAYDFTLQYIEGKTTWSADCLSRAPILRGEESDMIEGFSYINFIEAEAKMIDMELIKSELSKDEILSDVIEYVKVGWPSKVDSYLESYKRREKELYLEDNCLMLGSRVIIPRSLRAMVLRELHATHMGIVKMKSLARSFVWWPGIDDDIERITKKCELCLESSTNPSIAALNSWKWPEGPNMRIHVDFLQIGDKMYLVIIDAFSKWIDVKSMKDITTKRTVLMLQEYFAAWGFPVVLVSDNGPSLVSEEFESFLKSCGILHVQTAPYHPASNGAAENMVKTLKKQFKLLLKEGCKEDVALYRVLLCYRSTSHCTTGCTPAELQIGRPLWTRFDFMRPNLRSDVIQQQERQQQHAPGVKLRSSDLADMVVAKDVMTNRWI